MRSLLVALLLGVALVGCSVPDPVAPLSAPVETSAPPPSALSLPAPQPRPVKIEVPSIDIDGEIMIDGLGVDANGGHAEPTLDQPMLASWYNLGPRPGERGPAVVIGHVNGHGHNGVFATLHRATIGTRIFVTREDGSTVAFEVYRVEKEVPKTAFPANEIYGRTEGSEIRLITCGGDLDRQAHRYLDNVIVWATMVDAPAP